METNTVSPLPVIQPVASRQDVQLERSTISSTSTDESSTASKIKRIAGEVFIFVGKIAIGLGAVFIAASIAPWFFGIAFPAAFAHLAISGGAIVAGIGITSLVTGEALKVSNGEKILTVQNEVKTA